MTNTIKNIKAVHPLTLKEAEIKLEECAALQKIECINWQEYPYRPELKFRIAHTGNAIWLKFYVNEKSILARETNTNGAVHKDSCVEFFISPDGNEYYNFEFSCIGTIHLGHGPGRASRSMIAPDIAEKIQVSSTLGSMPFEEKTGDFTWEMMIVIPGECFVFDEIETFQGLDATANFYKCGDETADPHFVTWNPVKTENPDYHRPEYFGKIHFQ